MSKNQIRFASILPCLLLLLGSASCGECNESRINGYEYSVQFDVKRLVYREYDNKNETLLFENHIEEAVGTQTDTIFDTEIPPSFEDGYEGYLTLRKDSGQTLFAFYIYVGPEYEALGLNESISIAPETTGPVSRQNKYLAVSDIWMNGDYFDDYPLFDEYGWVDFEQSKSLSTKVARSAAGYQVISPFEPSIFDHEKGEYLDTGRFVAIELLIDDIEVVEEPHATEQVECGSN